MHYGPIINSIYLNELLYQYLIPIYLSSEFEIAICQVAAKCYQPLYMRARREKERVDRKEQTKRELVGTQTGEIIGHRCSHSGSFIRALAFVYLQPQTIITRNPPQGLSRPEIALLSASHYDPTELMHILRLSPAYDASSVRPRVIRIWWA
ncbi:hypothetical protein B0H10DRAFT_1969742 [Mycena sp. CBHHK59/15]|nr:hypothetical protein B0H10DRAFT_1969742 [Mycena sp. CBHHK59/15]